MFFNRVFLLVTDACDSRCVLCDYWLIKKPRYIDPVLVESKVVPFVRDNGISVICISGGEPTVHPQLGRIVKTVRETGASVTLTTSTTNLEVHFCAIRDLVTHYMISLDGPDRETYLRSRGVDCFGNVLGWVRRIRDETSSEVAISCVLQSCNITSTRRMYTLCQELGVQRLFFRVPDLKANSFGRLGSVRPKTIRQAVIDEAQVATLRADLTWLVANDTKRGLLGQSAQTLERKVQYFECIAKETRYIEEDQLCDVPLTSLVIQPDGTCRPCFYLPQVQRFDNVPSIGPAFIEVYDKMLRDELFRRQWCNACQQFDGHKHPIKVQGQ